MRFAILLLPMLLSAADLAVDHVTVAGSDLKTMQAKLATVGLTSEYGGPHANHVTEMAVVSFPDGSYLELIALAAKPDSQALDAHPWSHQMKENAGPCAWAARTKDFTGEIARLRAAGVDVKDPVKSGRVRPDGKRLDWETAQLGPEPNGTFFPFLIHDVTPRELRAFPGGEPSTKDFSGVTRVVIAVQNLEDSVKRYRQAYGLQPPLKQVDRHFGAQLALLGGTSLILAAPLHSGTWLAERIEKFGEGPCAFILGARKAGKYHAASKGLWFGADVSWFDSEALGWRLGFQ